ncbi:hypothetical protein BCV72DRAFT_198260 [Rhizopus microsporus var. microsporus]|uniref:Dol-P-Glc:Glc(2)Man(9)GlcNAc(2)-PP-Dol alpha-1,2-glucosyltransferase n=2 Tax=Rhizopus microsporus TaxID=58291 RepID=A0A2G4SNQ2_RHIZD|nr:uncharacterized protein RHIMIDRAFT_206072 [Rhizopus microsporus ATCC 52813]ORE11098.1 hypothetical protein BCV72DRAFT_198260 [Rhizopus microsporus var. microsporus]PHZ10016.1 hypothetical protein RHIMIDRAFT_206072 [Rhizopus microsporus ATCC 52813]
MIYFIAHIANLLFTSNLVYRHVPDPYMDEIFHIPQAQQYCQGNYFTWDPKITTPPGLYITSNVLIYLSKSLFELNDLCTVHALRVTNALFSIGLYLVLAAFFKRNRLYALTLAWLPVSHFYSFVYYTDSGSTFFVLLSYLLLKKKKYHLSGIAGMISLTFRQTNVIWVCLFMMLTIIETLSSKGLSNPSFESIDGWDKSNHMAGLHFPQLFYFTSFLSFFTLPFWNIQQITQFIYQLTIKRVVYSLISTIIALYLVHKYTYEHPFILSDNRHYSFYVWRKIYKRHWSIKYLLTPIYIISGQFNLHKLGKETTFLFILGYVITLILTLVPSPLLEFRYFIIPALFYMIHTPPPSTRSTVLALLFYICIQASTMYLFIYKPFVWQNEPNELQRFIW